MIFIRDDMSLLDKLFLSLAGVAAFATIAITAHAFVVLGKHDFVVEASCDPATETCFYRDCTEEDACPPNGLEYYRVFTLSAADFAKCTDNSCFTECSSGVATCEELLCGESEEDACSVPPPKTPVEEVSEGA